MHRGTVFMEKQFSLNPANGEELSLELSESKENDILAGQDSDEISFEDFHKCHANNNYSCRSAGVCNGRFALP